MRFRLAAFIILTALFVQNAFVFADEEFNAEEAFKDYASYDDSQVNQSYKNFYVVSNSNDSNSKALFSKGEQITDFIYDSIDVKCPGIIVGQVKDEKTYYGLIDDDDYSNILDIKYQFIEQYEVNGYITENTDGSMEYYILKSDVADYDFSNVDYAEYDRYYTLNADDFYSVLSPEPTNTITPIDGLDNCYVMDDGSGFYQYIVDGDGNKLVDTEFRMVDTKLGVGDTLLVWYPVGQSDSSAAVLNKNLELIVPPLSYSSTELIEVNGNIFIKAKSFVNDEITYYDIEGNVVDEAALNNKTEDESTDTSIKSNSYSEWAEESIKNAVGIGLVPKDLQCKYTHKISRQEFCRLAIQTYVVKTGSNILDADSPFIDVDDNYITTAYNLGIVAGVGDNRFAPNNDITRQEAAVMLNNLANVLNVEITKNTEKFIDEDCFASWAKESIYNVSGTKIMVGTDDNEFSPCLSYTREQAIATMYRLFNCESSEQE